MSKYNSIFIFSFQAGQLAYGDPWLDYYQFLTKSILVHFRTPYQEKSESCGWLCCRLEVKLDLSCKIVGLRGGHLKWFRQMYVYLVSFRRLALLVLSEEHLLNLYNRCGNCKVSMTHHQNEHWKIPWRQLWTENDQMSKRYIASLFFPTGL